jgi:hypothetical protein
MEEKPERTIDELIDHLVSVAQNVPAAYHWDSGLEKAREELVAAKNTLRESIKKALEEKKNKKKEKQK